MWKLSREYQPLSVSCILLLSQVINVGVGGGVQTYAQNPQPRYYVKSFLFPNYYSRLPDPSMRSYCYIQIFTAFVCHPQTRTILRQQTNVARTMGLKVLEASAYCPLLHCLPASSDMYWPAQSARHIEDNCVFSTTTLRVKRTTWLTPLTFWRRNYFFFNFSTLCI